LPWGRQQMLVSYRITMGRWSIAGPAHAGPGPWERLPPNAAAQKGQRLLASYREPAPLRALPHNCLERAVLQYELERFNLVEAVARDLLELTDHGGGWMVELEAYWLSEEAKQQQPPGKVHARIKACEPLCRAYENLIREVVGPHLLSAYNESWQTELGAEAVFEPETTVLYQFPPTLRIFCSATRSSASVPRANGAPSTVTSQPHLRDELAASTEYKALGRLHNDAQYGHQPGEVNFWLPLTRLAAANTLWAESEEGRGDFHPFLLDEIGYPQRHENEEPLHEGSSCKGLLLRPCQEGCRPSAATLLPIQRFHGVLCRHQTQRNSSGRTRVSLDFRCAPKSAFDAEWKLPGVLHRHEMREISFESSLVCSPIAH